MNDTPSQRRTTHSDARPRRASEDSRQRSRPPIVANYDLRIVEPDPSTPRDLHLEALWFELEEAWGPDGWGPIAVVGVPGMSAFDAVTVGERLAAVGAMIDREPVRLIDAISARPGDSELLELLAEPSEDRTIVVVRSPVEDPASTPLVRLAAGVVPVVQLGSSTTDQVDRLAEVATAAKITAVLCFDQGDRRSRRRRRRRRRRAAASEPT